MRATLAFVTAALALVSCASGSASSSPAPSHTPARTASPSPPKTNAPLAPPQDLHFQVQPLATGLEVPWEIAQAPNGLAFVTEREGRVRVLQDGKLQPDPALTLSVAGASGVESGLLGIAVHPGFPNPPQVYVFYTYAGGGGKVNRVSRFTYQNVQLGGEQVLLDNIPGGSCCHFGGRIAFGPDGNLYVATGDGQQPSRAEDVGSVNGKILRLRDDGSVPADNPFKGSPVYALGFRNPEGLAWDAAGHLYVSVNGPTGDLGLFHHDWISQVTAGGFYGWPLFAGNLATGQQPTAQLPNRTPPIAESGDSTWAPSGMTFYAPTAGQQPTLLIAALTGENLMRLVIDPADPSHVTGQQVVLDGYGRLRDVVATPDRCLLILTSNADGRGDPRSGDDKILRACPG
jgi:aldose sugar dehydrogenase